VRSSELLFIIYRSRLRVDPACHLSAVARAMCTE